MSFVEHAPGAVGRRHARPLCPGAQQFVVRSTLKIESYPGNFLGMDRAAHARAVQKLLSSRPVVAVLGARQVGKTTLARYLARSAKGPVTFFDLEDPRDRAQLAVPTLALEGTQVHAFDAFGARRPETFTVVCVARWQNQFRSRQARPLRGGVPDAFRALTRCF